MEHTCRLCGISQTVLAFRRVKGRRIDMCRTCELIPCRACAAMLPQHSFAPKEVNNHFSKAQHVVCLQCKERGCSARVTELYPCAGPCKKLLGHSAYTPADVSCIRRSKTSSIVCIACKPHDSDREQQLRRLMKKTDGQRAHASACSHTQKDVQCTCVLPENDLIQAATLCLERTQTGCRVD